MDHMDRNALSILVYNQPGVLVKVATVISGRGLNVNELTARREVGQPEYTRIVVDFIGEMEKLRQVRGQLEKLEVVKEVTLLSNTAATGDT